MILRGMDLPRRINAERLDVFEPAQRRVLEQELQALDQNLREALTRIEVNFGRLSPTGSFRTLPSDLFVPEIVETLPTLPNPFYPNGAIVTLLPGAKLWRNVAGTWTAAVPTSDLTGQITTTQITDDAVTTPKIATNAVETDHLQTNSVTAAKIGVSFLSAIHANMGTITAGKIDVGNIEINADLERILFGSATAPMTGTGIFMGLSSAVYQFRVGNPSGDYILWDGSALEINGESFTGANPVFEGEIEVYAAQGAVRVHITATGGNGVINFYDSDDAAAAGFVAGTTAFDIIAAPSHDLRLDVSSGDHLVLVGLPTADPGGSGRVWNDSGTLKIT